MLRKIIGVLGVTGILMTLGAVSTISAAGDDVPFPDGFRN